MVFPNREHLGKRLGIEAKLTLGWIASLCSQRRQKTMAIRNFNRRLGEAQWAAAIQMLFGNNNATVVTALSNLI
ncbi:hypothetical protein [Nitrosomonas halophila]|uniref:Uncharacterized protein n=1 Tax=Nitrosomonas halophila TaxID=44576 RepID=A0A1H3N6B5_9PROT|nr:hypothetical protein [Nitrosomonas halophila]SDY84220.1 hypothetical protein SAMN05421881_10689 [Nitrosomonas halophila]